MATIPVEVVGEEASDLMTDDTAPLVHEETRRERFKKENLKRAGGAD